MFLCFLAHDVLGFSFSKIMREVDLPHQIGNTTLQKNVKRIRATLAKWAKDRTILASKPAWDAAVTDIRLPSFMSKVRFWIDSSDFPIQRKKGRGKRSEHWSGKMARPARRYMFLADGDQVLRKMWGGYSPKVYDGHFVEINKTWFDNKLNGVAVVGDSHFYSVARELRSCEMIAPKPEGHTTDPETGRDLSTLTAEQQARNREIRRIRAPVEQPFARIKSMMQILSRPWAEDLYELDNVVMIGAAVHNYKKQFA